MNIKELERIVLNEKLKQSELLLLYKEYLIQRQKELSSIPKFESDYEYYSASHFTNCYAYALRLDIPKFLNERFADLTGMYFSFTPGVFTGKPYPNNMKSLIENTYSDLEELKIKPEYEIVILQEIKAQYLYKDFHFIRKNACGSYSSKMGISSYIPKTSYIDILDEYDLIKILK